MTIAITYGCISSLNPFEQLTIKPPNRLIGSFHPRMRLGWIQFRFYFWNLKNTYTIFFHWRINHQTFNAKICPFKLLIGKHRRREINRMVCWYMNGMPLIDWAKRASAHKHTLFPFKTSNILKNRMCMRLQVFWNLFKRQIFFSYILTIYEANDNKIFVIKKSNHEFSWFPNGQCSGCLSLAFDCD